MVGMSTTGSRLMQVLFVTGRLAEFALRQVLDGLAPQAGFSAVVAVLPISVAALLTPKWVARHLEIPEGIDRIILPGYCVGDLDPVIEKANGIPVERGPVDLRDLPRHFGMSAQTNGSNGEYSIQILAEINHAPRFTIEALIEEARRLRKEGADIIDVGCIPGTVWTDVGHATVA